VGTPENDDRTSVCEDTPHFVGGGKRAEQAGIGAGLLVVAGSN
jgi:hypothetical protein